jgi:hypothetical protein
MSLRTSVASGSWQNIGTGPAIVQLIAPDADGVEVMVVCAASSPTYSTDPTDGLVLSAGFSTVLLTLADSIWAQVVQAGLTAIVAVQPQAVGG